MVNSNYNSTEDMVNKIQQLKKEKLKFYKNISIYYDNMNVRFNEETFAKIAQGISKSYHEVLKLMKFLQTNINVNYS